METLGGRGFGAGVPTQSIIHLGSRACRSAKVRDFPGSRDLGAIDFVGASMNEARAR